MGIASQNIAKFGKMINALSARKDLQKNTKTVFMNVQSINTRMIITSASYVVMRIA